MSKFAHSFARCVLSHWPRRLAPCRRLGRTPPNRAPHGRRSGARPDAFRAPWPLRDAARAHRGHVSVTRCVCCQVDYPARIVITVHTVATVAINPGNTCVEAYPHANTHTHIFTRGNPPMSAHPRSLVWRPMRGSPTAAIKLRVDPIALAPRFTGWHGRHVISRCAHR